VQYVKIIGMHWLDRFSSNDHFRSLRVILADIVGLAVLAYLLWGFYQAITFPYDGIFVDNFSGQINGIDPSGPSHDQLRVGDVVLSSGGVAWQDGIPNYHRIGAGNEIHFIIVRDGKKLTVPIRLQNPPLSELFRRLSPLIVALAFWIVGVGVQMFNSPIPAMRLFYVVFLVSSLLLASGFLTSLGMSGVANIFGFLLWLIGPFIVHLHFYFPQAIDFRYRRISLVALYTFGLLGGLLNLVRNAFMIIPAQFSIILAISGRLFLVCCLLWMVGLLWYSYRHATTPGTQWKVRLIALGCILSLLPMVSLTVLPDTLFQWPILPFHYAFLLLGLVPATYGYVVFRSRLLHVDRRLSRGIVYLIIFTIIGSLFAIILLFIHQDRLFSPSQAPMIGVISILVSIGLYILLYPPLNRIVDAVFYGGWYDYRTATVKIVKGLESYSDLSSLAETISVRLVDTLSLQLAAVLLRDSQGEFSVFSIAPETSASTWPVAKFPPLQSDSLAFFQRVELLEGKAFIDSTNGWELSDEERQFFSVESIDLWMPVRGYGQIQGVLALGNKYGDDVFSQEDLDILSLVAQQIGAIVDNLHLLTQLRNEASKLEQKVKDRTAELHDSMERVETILASVADGVIVTDLDGSVLTVNAAFEASSGYRTTELKGQEFTLLFDELPNPGIFEEMRNILSSGQIWSGELMGLHKDGRRYPVQMTAAPVRDQAGKIMGYVGSQRDITRQKELEQLKDQLISNISHDLRTPITNICLYLDVLENAKPENREKVLAVLKEQSHLLRSIVSDVLRVQYLTTDGVHKAQFIEVNLNELAGQVLEMYKPLAATAGLKIIFESCTPPAVIRGDPEQLMRAISSLLANAIRYTRAGEIGIRVHRSAERLCLEVWDTGRGIESEDLPHIFDPFYRGHRVRESEMIGSGLGLTIVREVVKVHSGMVEVESEPGRGSRFQVCFPV
jgi:two-component system NtrC family sensor kinase